LDSRRGRGETNTNGFIRGGRRGKGMEKEKVEIRGSRAFGVLVIRTRRRGTQIRRQPKWESDF